MTRTRLIVGSLIALTAAGLVASTVVRGYRLPNVPDSNGVTILPNGWGVSPVGTHVLLKGDLPVKMSITPDGKGLVVVTAGWHNQGVSYIDLASGEVKSSTELGNAWSGLAFKEGKVVVSGAKTKLRLLDLTADGLANPDKLDTPLTKDFWTAGVATVADGIVVADLNHNALVKLDQEGKTVVKSLTTDSRPYAVQLDPTGKTLAVSCWAAGTVLLIDPTDLTKKSTIKVGSRPNELAYGPDGRLFVACSGDNTVRVIKDGAMVETIKTSATPRDLVGSTPIAVAVSPNGHTLYVANADNNDVAVVDISSRESVVRGFIPTGWYPSALAVSPDGKKLYVGVGKGLAFGANAEAQPQLKGETAPKSKYIASLLKGYVSIVDVPGEAALAKYTAMTLRNMPNSAEQTGLITEDVVKKAFPKIKHVVWVIRENRTYDQVFGDMEKGNNEKSLTMFGESVTPNAHRIARDFVLLDNLYCNGEVSQDGHQWCNAAYATDFNEKSWVSSYSGRSQPDQDDALNASPAGYLWDECRTHGKTYYSYGEFASFKSSPDTAPEYTGTPGLDGHASLDWNNAKKQRGSNRDYEKINVFIDDLKKAEKTGKWWNYMVMSLGEDHTSGLRAGAYTPQASVASNDLAIGAMVEAISHSKFWKDTAIFIMEDDAQNGPDHVDAHRTVGLVISPYVRRNALDSTMYTTASMLRTMELILGLPPMTQFDQRATPMIAAFTTKPDFTPYEALSARIDINAKNPTKGALVEMSNKLDWSDYDRADPDKLNEILWRALKPGQAAPAPVRSARIVR